MRSKLAGTLSAVIIVFLLSASLLSEADMNGGMNHDSQTGTFIEADKSESTHSHWVIVDDSDAVHLESVDSPPSLLTSWTAEGDQAGSRFGRSVASAGDVNNDGFDDIIAGAYYYDNGEENEGRVYLYMGSASGPSVIPSWAAEGDRYSANFGISVASAGDVNGDGCDDIIVGASGYGSPAYAYLGSPSGLLSVPSWVAESDQADAYFGGSVASAGDVNGDGYDDVVVGAHCYDNDEHDEGRACLYMGSASGLSTTPSWTAEGNQADAHFGMSVASAGDVNGDGYDDVVVGADLYDNGEKHEGRAFLYVGSASGLSTTPSWMAEGNQAEGLFGGSVASAGDVNGDGYDDIVIGAYCWNGDTIQEGRAYLYAGSSSGLPVAPSWTAESGQWVALFGHSVASAGDVNNDGFDDIVVGAPYYDNGEENEGRAYLYTGSASGLPITPSRIAESDRVDAHFGLTVASAGDVNGDGYDDIIVGENYYNGEEDEGRASLYLGGDYLVEEDDEGWNIFIESYGLALGIVIALVIIALVLVFVLKGRKGGKVPTSMDEASAGEKEVPIEGPRLGT